MQTPEFYAVVPAGGAGTRLWPLSRGAAPKFLHDLTGTGRTLIQGTWDRLVPLAGEERVMVVTGRVHAPAVAEQLPQLPATRIVTEPSPRESMAAIGLAAAIIARENPDAIMGSFAADHRIADEESFHAAIRSAIAVAQQGHLVTIGITPTWAATGFGYIRAAEPLTVNGAPGAVRVGEFVEKPDSETAEQYVASGQYHWNAGMFVCSVRVLLRHLNDHASTLHDGLMRIAEAWGTDKQDEVMDQVWPGLVRIAIDHAIAEPVAAAGGVAMVPGDFGWDDVGDWKSLAGLLPDADDAPDGMQVLGDANQVLTKGATGLVVPTAGRMVAVLGLDDVVVVDTPDAVLVTSRDRAQEVKGLVGTLKENGRTDLT